MAQTLSNKYFVKKSPNAEWEDLTAKFAGLKILKVEGMNEIGDALNVYSEQWIDSQSEDFLVTSVDELGNSVIVRKNVDLQLTFICGTRYGAIDTQLCHDSFIEYITGHGDFYIKSAYTDKEAHVVCLKGYKPTTQKLKRGEANSYIMGTIELHTIDKPVDSEGTYKGDLYIGFGAASISDPTLLANVQHYNTDTAEGNYTIICPNLSYLWICFSGNVGNVSHDGFGIPMSSGVIIGDLWCYRSANNIKPHTMSFSITSD